MTVVQQLCWLHSSLIGFEYTQYLSRPSTYPCDTPKFMLLPSEVFTPTAIH